MKQINSEIIFYYLKYLVLLIVNIRPLSWINIFLYKAGFRSNIQIHIRPYNLSLYIGKLTDLAIIKEVVIDQEYFRKLVRLEKTDLIIVDIGAGCGDFSIMCAKHLPEAQVYAFEPNPLYFSLLQRNIIANKVSNVIPLQQAVHSMKQFPHNIKRIDFLKIDCEGCEYSLLNPKNKPLLKRVNKISLEYHEFRDNYKISKLTAVLTSLNFTLDIQPHLTTEKIGKIFAWRTTR